MFYKKIPDVVEAIQWTGQNIEDFVKLVPANKLWIENKKTLVVCTLEGNMRAKVGDWIIKSSDSKFSCYGADAFRKDYVGSSVETITINSSLVEFNAMIDRIMKDRGISIDRYLSFKSNCISLSDLENILKLIPNTSI